MHIFTNNKYNTFLLQLGSNKKKQGWQHPYKNHGLLSGRLAGQIKYLSRNLKYLPGIKRFYKDQT